MFWYEFISVWSLKDFHNWGKIAIKDTLFPLINQTEQEEVERKHVLVSIF